MFSGLSFVEFLRENAALPVFFTVAVGFWIGRLRWRSFSLGAVTSVLLVGVAVGQLGIPIPEPAKMLFFLLFLFAIGYSVGPQFFRGLRRDGLPQVGLAVVVCLLCLGSVWAGAAIMGYDVAQAAGLLAGSQTMSAVLGVATDTIRQLPAAEAVDLDAMPVCYAVTYIFGTAGSAWILGTLGPRMLGGVRSVQLAAREVEQRLGEEMSTSVGFDPAARPIVFRAYRIEDAWFSQRRRTVAELERRMAREGRRLFVERLRQRGLVRDDFRPRTVLHPGDEVVLSGRRAYLIEQEGWIGPEVVDEEMLAFVVQTLPVVVRRSRGCCLELGELLRRPFMHGVNVRSIRRQSVRIPVRRASRLEGGDRLELVGLPQDVRTAASELGFPDPPTERTSMTFVGLGIFLGGLLFGWMLVAKAGHIPLSLTVSGGVLVAGLLCGWLRSRRPDLGGIPEPAVWLMNNMGLNVFIAIVGISTGPSFVRGFEEVGWSLFLVGAVATTVPLVAGVLIGRYLFRFNPAVALGCVAGSRTTTAALGAVEETLQSNVPAMGYTITYAIGNTLLIVWGVVIVVLVA